MKALTIVAVFVAIAALAGAVSVVRTLPATSVDDAAGIAYTETVTLGRYYRNRLTGPHHRADDHTTGDAFNGSILVDVRGLVNKIALQTGTWEARLFCPSAVAKHGDETFERTSVALSDGVTFTVRLATTVQDGLHRQSYRCWLRVKVGLPEDGSTIVVRDVLLPVAVNHSQHLAD